MIDITLARVLLLYDYYWNCFITTIIFHYYYLNAFVCACVSVFGVEMVDEMFRAASRLRGRESIADRLWRWLFEFNGVITWENVKKYGEIFEGKKSCDRLPRLSPVTLQIRFTVTDVGGRKNSNSILLRISIRVPTLIWSSINYILTQSSVTTVEYFSDLVIHIYKHKKCLSGNYLYFLSFSNIFELIEYKTEYNTICLKNRTFPYLKPTNNIRYCCLLRWLSTNHP